MKILLIENDKKKQIAITRHLISKGCSESNILVARTVSEFVGKLKEDIALFIIDLRVPSIDGASEINNGGTIIESIVRSGGNGSLSLAISSFPEDFSETRAIFEKYGCVLCDFKDGAAWKSTLDHLLIQARKQMRFDFLIFCALEEERAPYIEFFEDGKEITRDGIECFDITIGNKIGSVILLSKMGLVNAAVAAGICIDRYKPKTVAMSGICGGFSKNTSIGQLLISDMAYEYQTGKWTNDGFSQEPYQVQINQQTRVALRSILSRDRLIHHLEEGFFHGHRPSNVTPPMLAVFTSGSAVIASKEHLEKISSIHRKVAGLDMEIYAIKRAADLSGGRPNLVCAKVVVDLADSNKDDNLHKYGSHVSAKFIIEALKAI